MQRSEFIQALPKAELHLHIEGALPWEMVQARVKAWPSPPPWWATDYRFDNFGHFAQIIRQCYENTLTSVENYHLAAQGIFKNLAAQNVRYVELSFSLGHALSQQLPLAEIVAAIKQAAPTPLIVRVFCGVSRSRPHLLQGDLLETVLHLPELDGLDLHGDENAQGPAPFAPLFAQARQRGLATKAHAGELAGPQSMADIIDTLQLSRIEHGVRAMADEGLMTRLVSQAITLDMCPTSNLKLRVVDDPAAYPIRQFHQRGIRVTVNTDNPTLLGCSLTDELHLLVDCFGFSLHDLAQLQSNAFEVALIPAATRAQLLAEVEHVRSIGEEI
ncbi:MAG: adenosine deaminase [Anaerolineae bacterium]|nr:adenosine deaminase [Anaerolineae bacterium]